MCFFIISGDFSYICIMIALLHCYYFLFIFVYSKTRSAARQVFNCLLKAPKCSLLLNETFWSCCVICVLPLPLPEHGFIGYSSWLLGSNSLPDYSPGENFFTVFGVFFPAATGELHPDVRLSSCHHKCTETVLLMLLSFLRHPANVAEV